MTTHQTAKTQFLTSPSSNITYAYRRFGNPPSNDVVPLLFLHHFRGTMDQWDPLLINSIAAGREVILFDNAGVGKSSGEVDASVPAMAEHVLDFVKTLGVRGLDVLGFSMGGFVAQIVALQAPAGLVRRVVIAGSGPSWGSGVQANAPERQAAVGKHATGARPSVDDMRVLFFYDSPTSRAASEAWWARIHERNESTSGEARSGFVSEDYADGGAGLKNMAAALEAWGSEEARAESSFDRLGDIRQPVFIGQGSDDYMIPTVNSFVMQQRLPNARLKIFPDSGHGFLYSFAEEFAEDVLKFLS